MYAVLYTEHSVSKPWEKTTYALDTQERQRQWHYFKVHNIHNVYMRKKKKNPHTSNSFVKYMKLFADNSAALIPRSTMT